MSEVVQFKWRANSHHELLVSSSYFFRINEDACRYLGASVYELAQSNPAKTYQYLRRAIATTALEDSLAISYDGKIVADVSLEEPEHARSVAEDTMLDFMPTEYEGPFAVAVSILPDRDGLAVGMDRPINLFYLHVQPEPLAF